MSYSPATKRNERGFTIVELAVTSVVLTLVVAAVGMSFKTSFGFFTAAGEVRTQDLKANRGLEKLLEKLQRIPEDAFLPQMVAGESSPFISFQRIEAFVDGTPQFGPTHRVEWMPDPDDPEDGVDNNQNGLVDEGVVMLRVNPGEVDERREILARGVAHYLKGETANGVDDNGNGLIDECGLSFEKDGRLLTVRVTLLRVSDEEVVPWFGSGSVSLR
jgi:hypothetical protein